MATDRPRSQTSDDKRSLSHIEKGDALVDSNEAGLVGPHVKSMAEKKLVLKQDLIIIPQLMLLYFMAFVDRGNLGNAKLQGLQQDVLESSSQYYQIASVMLYVGLVAFQVPGNIFAKSIKRPDYYIGFTCIGWGISSTLQAAAFNKEGIWVCRFFVGMFEAMFVPSIPLYLSYFYTRREIGFRVALWVSSALSAGAFAGAIAYAVQTNEYSLARWRVLFISEGVPTIALGIFILLCLPSRPETSRIFNEAERAMAKERAGRTQKVEAIGSIDKSQIIAGAIDWRTYCGSLIYLGGNVVIGSTSSFLPSIVKGLGYTNADAQLYTVPPYSVAFVVLLVSNFAMDRYQTRGLPIASFFALSGIGYIILRTVEGNLRARYFAIFLIVMGAQSGCISTIGWVACNAASESKRAYQLGALIGIGQIGGIVGSFIYPDKDAPLYHMGSIICAAAAFIAATGSVVLYAHAKLHNRSKDRQYGPVVEGVQIDLSQNEKSPAWRYNP